MAPGGRRHLCTPAASRPSLTCTSPEHAPPQTVLEDEGPYIKLFDLRAKVAACNIYGRMAKSVMPYLLATHAIPRPLLLLIVPADKTEGSVFSRSDGHDGLVRWAKSYARAKELVILTSNEPRAVAAAGALADAAGSAPPAHRSTLAPLVRVDGGKPAEGAPSPSSFKSKFGESVSDLVVRLEPIVLEFEGATSPVRLEASHRASGSPSSLQPSVLSDGRAHWRERRCSSSRRRHRAARCAPTSSTRPSPRCPCARWSTTPSRRGSTSRSSSTLSRR